MRIMMIMNRVGKYYSYSPAHGMNYFNTEEEAIEFANNAIQWYRNESPELGWDENVDLISWGEVKQAAKEYNRREKPDVSLLSEEEREDIEAEFGDFDCLADYQIGG